MKTITQIRPNAIAFGIQRILLDMSKDNPEVEPFFPIDRFEQMIMESKEVDKKDAEYVTEKVIATGIIRWRLHDNAFVL